MAVFLVSYGVSAWSYLRNFEGGVTYEFCHYAEIGRNLAEGRGYRTRLVYPATFALLDLKGVSTVPGGLYPVLDRFPLQACLVAAAEKAGGTGDGPPAAVSILLLASCAAAVCRLGSRWFSPLEGLAAGACIALDPTFQRAFVLWGLPDFGFCLLTLGTTAAAVESSEVESPGWLPTAAGALAGLAWTARPNLILWLPLLAWELGRRRCGASRALALFAAGFAAMAAPAALYNLRRLGSINPPTLPWNLAHHTVVDTPPWLSYRTYSVSEVLLRHLPELSRKFIRYFFLHLLAFPFWWQMQLLFPAALAGAWSLRRGTDPASRWARLALAMLAVQLVAFSLLRYETLGPKAQGRYFIWFAPAAFLLAARGLRRLPAGAWAGVYAAVAGAFFLFELLGPQGRPAHPAGLPVRAWPELAAAARAAGCPAGLVATNLPGQLAWYEGCPSAALPPDPEGLALLSTRHPPNALLLSRLSLGETAYLPGWKDLLSDPAALAAWARANGWKVEKDFGTSVLLARTN